MSTSGDVETHVAGVLAGNRRALARTITLLESRRPEDYEVGIEILERLAPRVGGSIRLGITGAPGVGKSTLIEALGSHLIERGHQVAVLAIDPSSPLSGGSLLGDKTRMARLALHPRAYVRPSPSSGAAGGVAPRTREAVCACEAAGFDVVIVETVGVGQTDVEVESMVDFLAVLLQPGAGDELQGLKKGILELADALVVHKADGPLEEVAKASLSEYRSALGLLRPRSPHWKPPVLMVSSRTEVGLAELWDAVVRQREALSAAGELASRRREQARAWLWALLREGLEAAFRSQPRIAERLADVERKVEVHEALPPRAAHGLLRLFAT